MANTKEWADALSKVDSNFDYRMNSTSEVYSKIKNLGLETVIWKDFTVDNLDIKKISRFIKKNAPILFIWDPIVNSARKGYFFNITDIRKIEKYIQDKRRNLDNYNYLLTTQIDNLGGGFVGSVFSDGQGNIFCETGHRSGVHMHRSLSQPDTGFSKYLNRFITRKGKLISLNENVTGRSRIFITPDKIKMIIKAYKDKKGYFEFVYGTQVGKTSLYTTGHEPDSKIACSPEDDYKNLHENAIGRGNARIARACLSCFANDKVFIYCKD